MKKQIVIIMLAMAAAWLWAAGAMADLSAEDFMKQFMDALQKKDAEKIGQLVIQNPEVAKQAQQVLQKAGQGKDENAKTAKPVYGEIEITQTSIIGLPDKAEQELKSRLKSVNVFTTKGDGEDISCFPIQEFNLSPFPVNGTTLLAGEPLFFRWFENGEPCSEAVLVISGDIKKHEEKIRLGELKEIAASVFTPGKSYQWHIEQNGKAISETYRFRVLSQDESDSVRRQSDNVAEMYKNRSPLLFQAFYLQFISNETQDFYADSLRLLKKYMDETPKPDILIQRLNEHQGK